MDQSNKEQKNSMINSIAANSHKKKVEKSRNPHPCRQNPSPKKKSLSYINKSPFSEINSKKSKIDNNKFKNLKEPYPRSIKTKLLKK